MSAHPSPGRLGLGALDRLGEDSRPELDPRELQPGVVHFGFGAFHRAHQAVYTEAAAAAEGGGPGIVAVAPRDASVVAKAKAQDCLFSVTTRSGAGERPRVVGSVVGALHMGQDAQAVDRLISSSEVTTITLTVTEKGYHRLPDGGLNLEDPRVAADVAAARDAGVGTVPGTVIGRIAVSLANRYREGGAPIDVVSCDNLDGNGPALERAVRDFLVAVDHPDTARLLDWISADVGFPSTVVDRIVPATTAADLEAAASWLGVRDELAVAGEPYSQWVLQDAFRASRPAWEHGGAQFVGDVTPFQLTKLRLLNGNHSALAYLGLAAGCRTIADVLARPWGEKFVLGYAAEVAGTLPEGGPDPAQYTGDLVSRFGNPAIHHELRQIGSDGSLKLPQRWLTVLRETSTIGANQTLALAAWVNSTRPDASFGTTDPAESDLAACWEGSLDGVVGRLLTVLGARDLAEDQNLARSVESLLPGLARGAVPL